jgi:hypothetical protein
VLTSYRIKCRTCVVVIFAFGTGVCRSSKILGCKWKSSDGLDRIVTRSIKQGASSNRILVACQATDPGSPIGRRRCNCGFCDCRSRSGVLRSSRVVILEVRNSPLFDVQNIEILGFGFAPPIITPHQSIKPSQVNVSILIGGRTSALNYLVGAQDDSSFRLDS